MSNRLSQEVETLEHLDLHELNDEWQRRFGPVATFRSTELLRLMLAWRIQATVLAALTSTPARFLLAREPSKLKAASWALVRRCGASGRGQRSWSL